MNIYKIDWNSHKYLDNCKGSCEVSVEAIGSDWVVFRDVETKLAYSAAFNSAQDLRIFLSNLEVLE